MTIDAGVKSTGDTNQIYNGIAHPNNDDGDSKIRSNCGSPAVPKESVRNYSVLTGNKTMMGSKGSCTIETCAQGNNIDAGMSFTIANVFNRFYLVTNFTQLVTDLSILTACGREKF